MTIDTKKIFELKQEIYKLLQDKPELCALQDKIDTMLSAAGNQHNRCVLINRMMLESVNELRKTLTK